MANITVQFATNPLYKAVLVDGVSHTTPYSVTWVAGASHTISCVTQSGGTGIQYVWQSWSDYGSQTHTVAPTLNITYTCTFKTQYYLTMAKVGTGSISPASGWKDKNSSVSISATAGYGWHFVDWHGTGTGSYTGTMALATVYMYAPIAETATFEVNTVTLTVKTSPTGRKIEVEGDEHTAPYSVEVAPGTSVEISCPSPQTITANEEQYLWASWSDYGAQTHHVTVNYDTTVTATLTRQYYLVMTADPSIGGAVTPSTGWKNAGAYIPIVATPGMDYLFVDWDGTGYGSYSGTQASANITMNSHIHETANFISDLIDVTFHTNPTGLKVKVDGYSEFTCPHTVTWHSGDTHWISCTSPQGIFPGTRYLWASWTHGGLQTQQVSPVADITYDCNFDTQHFLTMAASPVEGGTVTPASQWMDETQMVTINATANPGWSFVEWIGVGGGYTGTDASHLITMLYTKITQTAYFEEDAPVPGVTEFARATRAEQRIPVASEFIQFIKYVAKGEKLTVWIGGKEFSYKGVADEEWRQFKTSPSKGTYYGKYIKGKKERV
jgi:hypothetical protein